MIVYLNGQYLPENEALISPNDRGFVFGDGVYEVTRVVRGKSFRMDDHMERLRGSLRGLHLHLPPETLAAIPALHEELVARNNLQDSDTTVYLQITRGAAPVRTHFFPSSEVAPTIFMSASLFVPARESLRRGVNAISVPDVRWQRCNLKTVNLLPNVLARQQAREAGADTALMHRDGVYTETPNANIFAVIDGVIRTYPLSNYILQGVTRNALMEFIAARGLPVREFAIGMDELFAASEVFVASTMSEVQAITEVDGKPIGDGRPGPVTRMLLADLHAAMGLA
jgi:D-alanine transaminase